VFKGLSGLNFRTEEGIENNGPWVLKPLTLRSNKHPYLLPDLPAGFCIRFKKSVLLKKKCLKPLVHALWDFVSFTALARSYLFLLEVGKYICH